MEKDWKKYSPLTTRIGWLTSFCIFALIATLLPEIKTKAYKPKKVVTEKIIEMPEQMKELEAPPPPPKPKMPVEAEEGEEDAVETIEKTDFTGKEALLTPELQKIPEFYAVEVKPKLVKYVPPKYPELGREAGIEGTVVLRFIIDTTGRVRKVMVVETDLDESFVKAAIEAVKKWRFRPAMMFDKKVPVWMEQPIEFRLKE